MMTWEREGEKGQNKEIQNVKLDWMWAAGRFGQVQTTKLFVCVCIYIYVIQYL